MRKQEWMKELIERTYRSWRENTTATVRQILTNAVEQAIDHPEFESDKPVYTYTVCCGAFSGNYMYTIYRVEDGEVEFDESGYVYKNSAQCTAVAEAIIEVLNRD